MRTERGKACMIEFSAPGKIHLLGEHTVVYGKPALLSAINLRVKVTISSLAKVDKKYPKDEDPLITRVQSIVEKIVKDKLKVSTMPQYHITISSQLPIGSGLGSSAAVSAAYLGALTSFLGYPWDLKLINELAFEAEKVFHGNPSGGDNTTVVYGGLIWYRKETEFLKLFSPLPFTIPQKIQQFVLIDSGRPVESTKEMVERVRIKQLESRIKVQEIFDDQERLVKDLVVSLKEGDQNQLVNIIRQGERNLEKLGVVGKRAQEIVRLVEKAGGAAKIMGGGGIKAGSGMLLAYYKNPQALLALAKKHHLKTLSITLGEKGLLQESSAP